MNNIDEIIYNQATANGMPLQLAALIVAQARHETGNYTSAAFTNCNNCFGYKYVGQDIATQCIKSSEADFYAGYDTINDSVTELTDWISRRQDEGKFPADLSTITTPDNYAALLKNAGYYGDSLTNYTNALIKWLQQIGANLPTPTGSGIILILLALGLIVFRKKIFSL